MACLAQDDCPRDAEVPIISLCSSFKFPGPLSRSTVSYGLRQVVATMYSDGSFLDLPHTLQSFSTFWRRGEHIPDPAEASHLPDTEGRRYEFGKYAVHRVLIFSRHSIASLRSKGYMLTEVEAGRFCGTACEPDGPSIHSKKSHEPLFPQVQNRRPLFGPSLVVVRSAAGQLHLHWTPAPGPSLSNAGTAERVDAGRTGAGGARTTT